MKALYLRKKYKRTVSNAKNDMEKGVKSERLLSVDIMRGITVAGMILVNNPGSWGHVYAPLRHAVWNGLTPTDLVFPFFMFIMGVSMCLSMSKKGFKADGKAVLKMMKRFVLIFLIGVALGWLGTFCGRLAWGPAEGEQLPLWARIINAANSFDTIRILGVLPRLALCYLFGSIIVMAFRPKTVVWISAGLLAVYSGILIFGNGYEFSEKNVLYVVDHYVLGEKHLYRDSVDGVTLAFDPEGLLGTLPSVAHVLIGFCCGLLLIKKDDRKTKALNLFTVGSLLAIAGLLLSYGLPLNKKIWSPTFVLTTCGMASCVLALLTVSIDIRGHRKGWWPAEVFGVNPLALYVLSDVLAILFGTVKIGGSTIGGSVYEGLCAIIPSPHAASLAFALLFVALNWAVGYVLYKRKIYIKL